VQKLCEKYKIVPTIEKELLFKDLIMLKTPKSGFFYEYKKNRPTILKEKEPAKPEPFFKKFRRE
jgi:hypothetical protein